MRAAGPAAGAAIAFLQLRTDAGYMLLTSFWLFDGDGPADPFITCEGSNVLPLGSRLGISEKGLAQVWRNSVDDAGGEPGGQSLSIGAQVSHRYFSGA